MKNSKKKRNNKIKNAFKTHDKTDGELKGDTEESKYKKSKFYNKSIDSNRNFSLRGKLKNNFDFIINTLFYLHFYILMSNSLVSLSSPN